jgi:hypothetical protein
MRPIINGINRLLLVLALALPAAVMAQETRAVTGVVVDAQSGAPVADVLVTIQGTGLRAVTDPGGRFEVAGVPLGSRQLVLQHVGYGQHSQPVAVGASGALDFRIRISSRAIELSPMVVEVASAEERARRVSGNPTNVIDRATIEAYARRGEGLLALLGSRVPSLRFVGGHCLEYRLGFYTPPAPDPDNPDVMVGIACRDITVYVDGIPSQQGSAFLQSLSPEDVERLQVLSPAEAGARYPDATRGVILVETRRGIAAETTEPRVNVNGFGWDEPQPYRWLRVLGVSAVGSAAVTGLVTQAFFDCSADEYELTQLRCNPMVATGTAAFTSAFGNLITRWAGRTPLSEGRATPGLLIGAATASLGYILYLHGEDNGSNTSRVAGQVVLAVGLPLSLTLSDRALRVLR